MKKIVLFIILGAALLLSACGKSPIAYTQNDFLRTFNIRMEEESLNSYMLISLDSTQSPDKRTTTFTGFNKSQSLQIEMVFDMSGRLTRFGLLTTKIPDEDFNRIIKIVRATFQAEQGKYTIKEGVSPNTGYRGIGFFLKETEEAH
ncbi:MAG: hypothetical protein FWE18_05690 [Alphaproteobacteria bacterium]|nr:hypothetical protein [Alphaproteobacteria bacterium]